jgi:hypothetical protein
MGCCNRRNASFAVTGVGAVLAIAGFVMAFYGLEEIVKGAVEDVS